ncbi:MAG: hypothetical protein S4CHLAM45_02570 [Chlamydiales bacterium]|nr:hypothetical protein [Chlamydiales bacterium]MCH9619116.1 hypothetical protein [Chlamydiales bacterium]MCH9622378.1 hypothetical protein [Chlamydiales bacterium]
MSDLTPEEIDGIVSAINQEPASKEELSQIPLQPPGHYGKVALSPIVGEQPRPLDKLTEREFSSLGHLVAHVEVLFGKTKLPLRQLASLKEGDLLPLDELCDDLVDIYVNDQHIGRGEIVTTDGHFGIKLVTLEN